MNKIMYETNVKYKGKKYDSKFILEEKNIRIITKFLCFKKESIIKLDDIKIINEKLQIKNDDNKLIIDTYNNQFIIEFKDKKETKKVINLILKIKTGFNFLERASKRYIGISKNVLDFSKKITSIVVVSGSLIVSLNQYKDDIKEALSNMKGMLKFK